MKYQVIAITLWFICGVARATGPLVGLEFESEKNNRSGITNHAVDIVPGWEFSEESLINRIELLIERNQDTRADADGLLAKENKLFVRIRHDGDFTDTFGYYIRGGVGRSFNNQRNFNFAYVEPGIEYKFTQRWAWTLAIREINSIDSVAGQRITQIRTGPSLDFDKNNELEFLYVKGSGDANMTSWVFEYVHKF
jgi:hypothetical protein